MPNMTPEELHPKPTDSEQLDKILDNFVEDHLDTRTMDVESYEVYKLDKAAAKAAISRMLLEARIETLQHVWDNGVKNNSLEAEDAYITEMLGMLQAQLIALTAALGPDNSKAKE